MDSNWDLKAVVLIQVSYDQYKSFRATELHRASELRIQSFRATRATELQSFEQRYENAQNTVKHCIFRDLVMGN